MCSHLHFLLFNFFANIIYKSNEGANNFLKLLHFYKKKEFEVRW